MFHLLSKAHKADSAYNSFMKQKEIALKELNGLFNNDDSLVTLRTLRSLKFGKWYYNEDKTVKFKLVRLTEKEAFFISEINPIGGKPAVYGLQRHDCTEKGIVKEGHLIDDVAHLKKLKGESWEYKKNQKHEPYATIRSVYEVTFTEE